MESRAKRGSASRPAQQQPQEEELSETQVIRLLREYDENGDVESFELQPASPKQRTSFAAGKARPYTPASMPAAQAAADVEQAEAGITLSPTRRGDFLSSLLDASLPPMNMARFTKKGCFLSRLGEIARDDPRKLARLLNEFDRDGDGELDRDEFSKLVQRCVDHALKRSTSLSVRHAQAYSASYLTRFGILPPPCPHQPRRLYHRRGR